ncbi:hypothetical protein Tco_0005864 [Tanacetum coccineum]
MAAFVLPDSSQPVSCPVCPSCVDGYALIFWVLVLFALFSCRFFLAYFLLLSPACFICALCVCGFFPLLRSVVALASCYCVLDFSLFVAPLYLRVCTLSNCFDHVHLFATVSSDPGRDVCRLGIGRCCCAEGRSPNFWSLPCSSATSAGSLSFLRRQLRGYIGELCLVPVISVDTFRLLGLFRLLVLVVTARIGPRSRVVTTTDPAVYSPLDFLSRLGPVPVWLSVGGSSLFASLSVR